MGRTWAGIAAVWVVASGLFACHARKQSVIDAGGEPEEADLAIEAAASSASAPASASAEPAPRRVAHCETGEVAIVLPQGDETCVVECKSTSDCPPTWTCDGEGPISHNGRPGNGVHFCRSAAHGRPADGGSSPDASHAAHAPDAGAPPKKLEHHDGGAKSK